MPQILVVADTSGDERPEILLTERVAPTMLASEHYSAQLLERVRWAVDDAIQEAEQEPPGTGEL